MKPPHSGPGRPPSVDPHKLVANFLRSSKYTLDDLTQLESLPGVKEKKKQYEGSQCSLGKALKELLDSTVQQIIVDSESEKDQQLNHIAIFLRVWYIDRGTVAKAARTLKLTRSYVSREIKRDAIDLVVKQFFKSVEDSNGTK